MEQRISVSKAARLLGIKGSELSRRLHAAGVPTFEGEVDFEKVKCIAPSLNLSEPEILRRLRYTRDTAVKPVADGGPRCGSRDLSAELQKLSSKWMVEAELAGYYRDIINELAEELGRQQESDSPERRELAYELCQWLRAKICAD